MESQRGSFGYHYLLFVPLCFLLYPARWPWIAKISLAAALVAVWFMTRVQFNLRYLYPALPWIMLAIAASWAAVCQNHRRLFFRALITTCVAAVVLNAACLAASNWYHKDFCMTPFKPQRRNAYIEGAVPGPKARRVYESPAQGRACPVHRAKRQSRSFTAAHIWTVGITTGSRSQSRRAAGRKSR